MLTKAHTASVKMAPHSTYQWDTEHEKMPSQQGIVRRGNLFKTDSLQQSKSYYHDN